MNHHVKSPTKFQDLIRDVMNLTPPKYLQEHLQDLDQEAVESLLRWALMEAMSRATRLSIEQAQAQEGDVLEWKQRAIRWRKTAHVYRNGLENIAQAEGTAPAQAMATRVLTEGAQELVPREAKN